MKEAAKDATKRRKEAFEHNKKLYGIKRAKFIAVIVRKKCNGTFTTHETDKVSTHDLGFDHINESD